jgi:hypothetical protein
MSAVCTRDFAVSSTCICKASSSISSGADSSTLSRSLSYLVNTTMRGTKSRVVNQKFGKLQPTNRFPRSHSSRSKNLLRQPPASVLQHEVSRDTTCHLCVRPIHNAALFRRNKPDSMQLVFQIMLFSPMLHEFFYCRILFYFTRLKAFTIVQNESIVL